MRQYRFWKKYEFIVMRAGLVPTGRTPEACWKICKRLGLKYPDVETVKMNLEILENIKKKEENK